MSTGINLLSTARRSKLIEKDMVISIPLHILFDPNITLQHLTDLIHHPSQLQPFSCSTPSQLATEYRWDPPSIVLKQRKVSTIFITGTTAFVGAFLLAELLRVYPPDCRMICLVRGDDPLHRLRQTLISFHIWNDADEHRLTVLHGDRQSLLSHLTNKHFNRWWMSSFIVRPMSISFSLVINWRRTMSLAPETCFALPPLIHQHPFLCISSLP
jgi:hypothetical protein